MVQGAITQSLLWACENRMERGRKRGGWNGQGEWEGKRARKIWEHTRFKTILWLLLPPVPALGQWRPLWMYISFSSFPGNGRVMCKWPCSPSLSLSISFPSSISLGYAAIWLFIAAWAEALDVSYGIWSWFNDVSVIPLHFLYGSFVPLEHSALLYPIYIHVPSFPQNFPTLLFGF